MIQVNLIPDLKAEFLRAQRTKRFVISLAVLISGGFIGVVAVMFLYVNVWQQEHTNNLKADIQTLTAEYQSNENLDKIVTVQNQLNALPELHAEKPLVSRLVTVLSVITPDGPEYRSVELDFESQEVRLVGTSGSPAEVNKLANTVKNAIYVVGDKKDLAEGEEQTRLPAFSNVILDTLTTDEDSVNFTIVFEFDTEIFNNHDKVTVSIPEIDSTNSEVSSPSNRTDLFNSSEEEEGGQ